MHQFCNQIKSDLNIFKFAQKIYISLLSPKKFSTSSKFPQYIFSICIPIKDKTLSTRAAFGSQTRRSVTFLYQIYRIVYAAASHCHIKYYLCSLAHKRDRLTRLDPSFACVRAYETYVRYNRAAYKA